MMRGPTLLQMHSSDNSVTAVRLVLRFCQVCSISWVQARGMRGMRGGCVSVTHAAAAFCSIMNRLYVFQTRKVYNGT